MAKKAQKRAGAKRARPAGKRDLVRRPKASAYAKRTARGRFKEMDDVGRSQKADKARKARRRYAAATATKATSDPRPRDGRGASRWPESPRHAEHDRRHSTSSTPSRTTA